MHFCITVFDEHTSSGPAGCGPCTWSPDGAVRVKRSQAAAAAHAAHAAAHAAHPAAASAAGGNQVSLTKLLEQLNMNDLIYFHWF